MRVGDRRGRWKGGEVFEGGGSDVAVLQGGEAGDKPGEEISTGSLLVLVAGFFSIEDDGKALHLAAEEVELAKA